MALKLKNKQYIKVDANGNYTIYASEQARTAEKSLNGLTPDDIIKKYIKIIESMKLDEERWYYDPSFSAEISQWEEELRRYTDNLSTGTTGQEYPLMKKYINKIDRTIPQIVARGTFNINANSAKEVYEIIKKYKIWAGAKDV